MQKLNKMKKIFIFACAALFGLCASAQEKGDMAVGLNLGVAPCIESGASVTNFGIGAKFQYNVSNPIRLEAAFDYGFKNKGAEVMTLGVNAHYIFKVSSKISVYPLVGLGYAHCKATVSNISDIYGDGLKELLDGRSYSNDYGTKSESGSSSKFFFNVGVGGQYDLSDKVAVNLEIKYQYIKDFNRLPISLGIAYKF